MGEAAQLTGPDFAEGVRLDEVGDGKLLLGQVAGEAVLLARRGDQVWAVGATCTHYGGPLGEGLLVGHEVRCPWHHGCFDVRTGEVVGAPPLKPIECYTVEREGALVRVRGKREPAITATGAMTTGGPDRVVIVGAGAAGNAAAETLRHEGYAGTITLVGAEDTVPVDRPNLSKDYLAGSAPEEWIPLRDHAFYEEKRIALRLGVAVTGIDAHKRQLSYADGGTLDYDALLLATGADPIRLTIPGADQPHVHYLRSLADSRAIIERAKTVRRAVVVGASFIGLEVAASLRARDIAVDVVAPDRRPLERVLGPEMGDFVCALHEAHGVRFRLGHTLRSIEDKTVTLDDGTLIDAELVVAGVGVRPSTALAEQAGCRVERGVIVDQFLETSVPAIWAAGDIARFPDRHGRAIRVEHWVVAERLGQTAARNLLGRREPFRAVPFFWSQHYDVAINYVGHAEGWDGIAVLGSIADRSCVVAYRVRDRIAAVATIHRDRESLLAEAAFERDDQPALEAILAGQD